MRPIALCLSLASSFLLAACAGRYDDLHAVAVVRDCEVTASGSIGLEGMEPPPSMTTRPLDADSADPEIRFLVRAWRADGEAIARLAGTGMPGVAGRVLDAEAAEAAASALDGVTNAEERDRVELEMAQCRSSYIELIRQVSHVARFDLKTCEGVAILDPIVEIESLGARVCIDAEAEAPGSPIDVAIKVELAEAPLPFAGVTIPALSESASVSLEVPCIARIELGASTRLEHTQSLLLVAPDLADPSRGVAILIHGEARAPAARP